MTISPLLRLAARNHLAALRWCALVYNHPRKAIEVEKSFTPGRRCAVFLTVYLNIIFYQALIMALGGWPPRSVGIVSGLLVGVTSAAAFRLTHGLILGIGLGIGTGLIVSHSIIGTILMGACVGLVVVTTMAAGSLRDLFGSSLQARHEDITGYQRTAAEQHSLSFKHVYIPNTELANRKATAVVMITVVLLVVAPLALVAGKATGNDLAAWIPTVTAAIISYLVIGLRLYYLPFHLFWIWPKVRPEVYHFHPIAWDHVCPMPFPGIQLLLVSLSEYTPAAGEQEIDRLIDGSLSNRRAALLARAILVIRSAAKLEDLGCLDEILANLPEATKGSLRQTPEVRLHAHSITSLQSRLNTLDRPFLREPYARLLVKEIETFERRIENLKAPLSTELRKASREWLSMSQRQLTIAQAATAREPKQQVFRAGNPVNKEQEAFVNRASILGQLEQQVTLASGCPGLLVYGRRRMGKSTLLGNLDGFLPSSVQVVRISMQDPHAFTSLSDFIGLIGRGIGSITHNAPEPPEELKEFERFLEMINRNLQLADHRLLLAIDEFEYLDRKIGEGVFSQDLLAMMRRSIEEHRRVIWAFVGSHSIEELIHAPWASYLVSARTLEVHPFELAETRLLLTEPMKHSSLYRDMERPRFEPGFWGAGGIERIHSETGGWPHLVQLVAENLIDFVNDSEGAAIDSVLFERALDRSVIRGDNVFLELLKNESQLPGEWEYLLAFRKAEEQPLPANDTVARSLRQRLLVLEEGDRYRLRVPLMGRWLRQRA
jgi:hypothetical protein